MATRIHNFSYSGSTGLLQFVPCIGDEKACKVYIKSIVAYPGTGPYADDGLVTYRLRLLTKSANNLAELTRAYYESTSGEYVTLAGGCTSISSITTIISPFPFQLYSGVGFKFYDGTNSTYRIQKSWNVPEYFYMKPGDTLTFNGYTGTFHIELMAISES